jgi:long-chain acyl-CoA synthetase
MDSIQDQSPPSQKQRKSNHPEPWKVLDQYRGRLFSGTWPTLPELFTLSATNHPDRPCFTIFNPNRITLTYGQALEKIQAIAQYLANQGIQKGDRVAVSGKNSPEWAVAYLSVLFAGAVVVPIDYQLRVPEIQNILRASGAKGLFVDEEKYPSFSEEHIQTEQNPLLVWSLSTKHPGYIYDLAHQDSSPSSNSPATATQNLIQPATEEDLAAILYTSGTTGIPKGVMLTHQNFIADCYLAQAYMDLYPTDVFYALLPLHHSYTMLAVFIEAISVGAELVFGQKLVTSAILHDLKAAQVTMFLGVPMLFNKVLAGIMKGIKAKGPLVYGVIRFLMKISGGIKKTFKVNPGKKLFGSVLDKASLRSIRICISGGGPLAPEVFKQYNQLGIDFVQGYGLTETSPILTLNPVKAYKETSVGKILPRVECKIDQPDDEGRGEILVRGPMVMEGYYNNPEATAEVLDQQGWFRTGDVGYLDRDNYLYLTGRCKNLIVTSGGKNVYPEEIENAFQLYSEIEQILVRGFIESQEERSENIEALIYPNKEVFPSQSHDQVEKRIRAIVDEVNPKLQPYQKIVRVTVLEEPLEMTTTKKIKRG